MENQYTKEEQLTYEEEMICLICCEKNNTCSWVENEENGCYTFCCTDCYTDKDNDDTGYWGMRGCCKCKEEQRDKLIMGSCVCEKYFNLCSECATTNNEGNWYCNEGDCKTTKIVNNSS